MTKFDRRFKPRFSYDVHQVARVQGGTVVDTEGKRHPTKFAHPVPSESAPVEPRNRFVRRGSAQVQAKRQVVLKTYATSIAKDIRKAGGTLELWRVGTLLEQMGGFDLASRGWALTEWGDGRKLPLGLPSEV